MNIFLIEDNDLDVELLQRGLKRLGSAGSFLRAKDGIEALDLLSQNLVEPLLPNPFVILLDINMPRMNGHEFLHALRQSGELGASRVIVFTTSDNPRDVQQAYDHLVTGYVVKPNSSSDLAGVLTSIQSYWSLCEHPRMMPH